MNKAYDTDKLANEFATMQKERQIMFLVTFAHNITILSRNYFEESNFKAVRQCNECLHRAMGFIAFQLLPKPHAPHREFFLAMVELNTQMKWGDTLARSMKTAREAAFG